MVLPYCKSCIDLTPEAGLAICTVPAKDGCKLCVKCYGRPALREMILNILGVGIVNARDAITTSGKFIIPSRILSLNHIIGVFML